MKQLLAAPVVLFVCAGLCFGQDPGLIENPRTLRKDDFTQLLDWVELEHAFTPETKSEALDAIQEHLEEDDSLSDAEFYMELRRIVALADNGHYGTFLAVVPRLAQRHWVGSKLRAIESPDYKSRR